MQAHSKHSSAETPFLEQPGQTSGQTATMQAHSKHSSAETPFLEQPGQTSGQTATPRLELTQSHAAFVRKLQVTTALAMLCAVFYRPSRL